MQSSCFPRLRVWCPSPGVHKKPAGQGRFLVASPLRYGFVLYTECILGLIGRGCPIGLRRYVRSHARTCPTTNSGALSRGDQRRAESSHREAQPVLLNHPRFKTGCLDFASTVVKIDEFLRWTAKRHSLSCIRPGSRLPKNTRDWTT